MTNTVPNWKFWHPLALWKAIVIFVAIDLGVTFTVVAIRELGAVPLPDWLGATLGGGVAGFTVPLLAWRARMKSARTHEP